MLLAASLLHDALITIFDEPTSNLDPQKLKLIYNILKNPSYLRNKIIITHNLDFAYQLKFNILYLKNGRVEFIGTNNDFFNNKNLDKFYNKTVIKTDNKIVIDL